MGVVGLGRIADLNLLGYLDSSAVEIAALVDPDGDRRSHRSRLAPAAVTFESVDDLASSGTSLDAVEVLVPIVAHADTTIRCLERGWHVNLQKPVCNDLDEFAMIRSAAASSGATVRVMENYLFYEPLVRLKHVIESGELGEIAGYHMKMVASGRGGWDVPGDTYARQFEQAARGRGPLVFDDGWHKLSTMLWLFGPVREVRAWIGETEVIDGVVIDAPSTLVWEHANGVRGVWDVTLAVDMYLRSDYYTNDERWEVTGRRGFARVNRCTARGLQQPSLEVYVDGVLRSYHALEDDWALSFRRSTAHWIDELRRGVGPSLWSLDESEAVLRLALAAYESSQRGGVGVDPGAITSAPHDHPSPVERPRD